MKKHCVLWFLLLAIFSLYVSCKKSNENFSTQQDILPPVTQIGANTFGCLVNGKIYIPRGYRGNGTPNPNIIYSLGLNGLPYLQIDAGQFEKNNQVASFVMNIDSLTSVGVYSIYTTKKQVGFGSALFPNCGTLPADTVQFKTGLINVTSYNLSNRIIAGTFNFKIKPYNCDTLFITEGRFDIKF